MDDDKILELTGNIEKTLGKEAFATISDTIGELLTGNAENMKSLAQKDEEIKNLKSRNDKLVSANGALLQRVPMGYEKKNTPEPEEDKTPKLNIRDAFDNKGNFIH